MVHSLPSWLVICHLHPPIKPSTRRKQIHWTTSTNDSIQQHSVKPTANKNPETCLETILSQKAAFSRANCCQFSRGYFFIYKDAKTLDLDLSDAGEDVVTPLKKHTKTNSSPLKPWWRQGLSLFKWSPFWLLHQQRVKVLRGREPSLKQMAETKVEFRKIIFHPPPVFGGSTCEFSRGL